VRERIARLSSVKVQLHGQGCEHTRCGWEEQGCGGVDAWFRDRQERLGLIGLRPPSGAREVEVVANSGEVRPSEAHWCTLAVSEAAQVLSPMHPWCPRPPPCEADVSTSALSSAGSGWSPESRRPSTRLSATSSAEQ
jgi:hypothetical protein